MMRSELQVLPPWLHCSGATMARMQVVKCWEAKRESDAKGYPADPCGPMLLSQVRNTTTC